MKCLKCGSDNVVIATAGNGFGGWKCNNCNASGVYPPKGRMRSLLAIFALLALPALARASDDDEAQAALALARARQQAPAPPQAPPTKERTIFDFLAEHPGEAVVIGRGCKPPPTSFPTAEFASIPGWDKISCISVGLPGRTRVGTGYAWYQFTCHATAQEITEFVQQQMNPPPVQTFALAYAPSPVYGGPMMMGGAAFCVGSS
jgi:hypothetical protein